MVTAILYPATTYADDRTLDQAIRDAADMGLVPCNPRRGPFRVAFINPDKIPAGWCRITVSDKRGVSCSS